MLRDYRPRLLFRARPKNGRYYSVELEDMNGDKWRFGLYARSIFSARVMLSHFPPVLCGEMLVYKIWSPRVSNSPDYVFESWTRK